MNPLKRREFLKLMGCATAASLPGLWTQESFAQNPPRQRVIFYTSPNGSRIIGGWRPRLESGQQITAEALQPILRPLAGYVDQMLLVEGLDLALMPPFYPSPAENLLYPSIRQTGHAARSSLWTGHPLNGVDTCQDASGFGTGPSIDQLIARGWGLDPADNHVIKIGRKGPCVFSHTSSVYAGDNSPIVGDFLQDAYFRRIWGEQAPPTQLERAKLARRRGFEFAMSRLSALSVTGTVQDQTRFGRHLESLERSSRQLDVERLDCDGPPRPVDPDNPNLASFNYIPHTTAWLELVAAAIRCDAARVFSINWGDEGATGNARWLNSAIRSGGIHPISHEADQDPNAHQVMVDFNRFHATELARFMGLLAAIPEADGSSALDNTLIVWGLPMSEGATHSSRNLPFVLLGGRRSHLRMGRYHNFGNWPVRRKQGEHDGQPHTLLLTTLLHALGIADVDHVGSPDIAIRGNLDTELLGL